MNFRSWPRAACFMAAFSVFAYSPSAHSQDLSSGTVRILVPFSAGGSLDFVARLMAEELSDIWGASVIVENKPGAAGMIASQEVAAAAPDGRTMILLSAAHSLNPSLYQQLPYDTEADFTPIARVSEQANVFLASNGSSYESAADVVAAGREGTELRYGVSGVGTSVHLSGILFGHMAGIDFQDVQFPGGADTVAALMGNHIDLGFSSIPGALDQINEGAVRAIGVTGKSRYSALPDVPTIDESGLPDFEVVNWWGLLGPAGMDPALVAYIHDGVSEALSRPAAMERLNNAGVEPDVSTPEEFADIISGDIAKWGPVLEAAGIEKR